MSGQTDDTMPAVAGDGQQSAHLELMFEAAAELFKTEDVDSFIETVSARLLELLRLEGYFHYRMVEPAAGEMELASYRGVSEESAAGIRRLKLGEAVCGTVALSGERAVIADIQRSTDPITDLLRGLGITTYACFPIEGASRLFGTFSFFRRDGSDFSAAETSLLQSVCDLIGSAFERYRATQAVRESEARLRRAKEEAERASQAKSQFLSTISHELRTPLTAVIGLSDLMGTEVVGPMNEKQKKHLARINSSAWLLVGIIDEILTFTRSEAGKEEVRLERVNVAKVVRDVVDMLRPEAEAKSLALRLTGAEARVPATTDEAKVRRIVTNLVGNAVKYTREGAVHVELEPDGERVALRVRDTGPGIEPDRLEEIFEPFVQVDGSTTRTAGGTGLGLTICRRLATLLGGDVTVESTPGEGSVFTLTIDGSGPR